MLHAHILMEIPEHPTRISFFENNCTRIAYLHIKESNVTYTRMAARTKQNLRTGGGGKTGRPTNANEEDGD